MTPERKAYLLSRIQFPQLTANESSIARQWILKHADEFDDMDFNVRLGSTVDRQPGWDEATWSQAQAISQKRADLVAWKGDQVTIVEVKLRVALSAMGQLLGYRLLWQAEHPETANVTLQAIGNSALVDVHDILLAHGISVELYPEISAVLLPQT